MHLADCVTVGYEGFQAEIAEGSDYLRLNNGDLCEEVFAAIVEFGLERIAVVGWTAFQRIGDEDLPAFEAGMFEQVIEQLTRLADERDTLEIFITPRGFSDEQDVGAFVPGTGYDIGATLGQFLAPFA